MKKKIFAYVSMEILLDKLPTYAGGLGILAGDMISSADDLNFPLYGVTLVNRKGYVKHKIEDGKIIDLEENYEPLEYFKKLDFTLEIKLKNLTIYLDVWEYKLKNNSVFLLDTNTQENPKEIRKLTDRLYIENNIEERILKELILGIGTIELFEKLGWDVVKYHINESHGGFLAIELFKRLKDLEKVRKKIVFTTHTPLPHGHERFPYELVEKYYDIPKEIKRLSPNELNLSKILFQIASYSNAVSWKHWIVTRKLIPEAKNLDYITNGVYHLRWVHRDLANLYDKYIKFWREEPALLVYAGKIPPKEFKEVKRKIRRELIDYVNSNAYLNKEFSEDYVIISARRRITGYKRVDLILRDIEKLEELSRKYKIQILFSGVSHPKDDSGKATMRKILDSMSILKHTKVAFIPKRGVEIEKYIISGTDIFLHTPLPPFEACGTSWMRAAINGVPTLASKDGGVIEIVCDGYNGWLFGENRFDPNEPFDERGDLEDFYRKLEIALKTYRENEEVYYWICINAIKTVGSLYNSYRMLEEYISEAYLR